METEPSVAAKSARLVVEGREGVEIHRLDGGTLTVGRAAGNDVILTDPRCSRHHLRIEPGDGAYRFVDLGSQNGTLKNGRRVRSGPLRGGDVIQVGSTRLVFEEPGAPSSETDLTRTLVGRTLSPGDAPDSGILQRLKRLAQVTAVLNSRASSEEIFELIVDAAIELTSSERGFLIECRKEGMEFAAARNIAREDLGKPEFELSWSIAIQVGSNGSSVLTVNAAEDERFRSLESVEALGLRSVVCVPVKTANRVVGVIYVDNRLHKGAYSVADRELLEVLADHAGIAMTTRRLVGDLTRRTEEVEELNRRLAARVEAQDSEIRQMRARMAGEEDDEVYRSGRALVGGSARMDELRHLIRKVAMTDFPVLVTGESGTGKELVARSVHCASGRARGPFVSLNCAAVPETLLENELFGHARGAFTGADRAKKGLFEIAHGGTLFLDEVSEMSPGMQTRFLRVLQEGEIRPVGGKDPIQVDVRIVAASNRDLALLVQREEFREDLYYRLRVLPVPVPALRERREDIPDLISCFFRRHGAEPAPRLEPEVLDVLCSYGWPGNVRELENEVKRLIALAGPVVTRASLSRHILDAGQMLVGCDSSFHDLNALVESIETREITKALARSEGNKTRAASLLGISRFTLQRKLDKYGIRCDDE